MKVQVGHTLLESIITVSVLCTVSVIAIPSLNDFYTSRQFTAQSAGLHSSLNLARTHAIANIKAVVICAVDHQGQCVYKPKRLQNWQYGWKLYVDENDNGLQDHDDIEIQRQTLHEQFQLVFNQHGRIRFDHSGRARSGGFYLCDKNAAFGHHFKLLHTGRVRVNPSIDHERLKQCQNAI